MNAQRFYKFLILFILVAVAQKISAQAGRLSVVPLPVIFIAHAPLKSATGVNNPSILPLPTSIHSSYFVNPSPQAVIEPDYYTRHFGYFCKKELQFEKATAIPLKFRLGTLDYVNRMEGK